MSFLNLLNQVGELEMLDQIKIFQYKERFKVKKKQKGWTTGKMEGEKWLYEIDKNRWTHIKYCSYNFFLYISFLVCACAFVCVCVCVCERARVWGVEVCGCWQLDMYKIRLFVIPPSEGRNCKVRYDLLYYVAAVLSTTYQNWRSSKIGLSPQVSSQ